MKEVKRIEERKVEDEDGIDPDEIMRNYMNKKQAKMLAPAL